MARDNEERLLRRADAEVRTKLPPGITLVRTLRGHNNRITRIAWTPDGKVLASPSEDGTIRLWNAETGKCLHTIEGAQSSVNGVAFDPSGRILASGSNGEIRVWEPTSGKMLRSWKAHTDRVSSVAFHPEGRILASGSDDHTVKLWESTTGKLLRSWEDHADRVNNIAFDRTGRLLASASHDHTVRVWEIRTGRCLHTLQSHPHWALSAVFAPNGQSLATAGGGSGDSTVKLWHVSTGSLLHTLEGHAIQVLSVAYSSVENWLASKGSDGFIRIWHPKTHVCVASVPEPATVIWGSSLAFHPNLPLLATVGSDPGAAESQRETIVHIWKLDSAVLLRQPATATVTYTSAKVVLVGESNVGKSYLAHRIATGGPPETGTIKSTHGMKFWPLEPDRLSPALKTPEGQRRDVVLWDMGGQEEYRLIHQLFMYDTTVALMLLDPTRGITAFKEIEGWNKSLEKQLRGRDAVKLLVGTKVDQPSQTIDRQALGRLVNDCGFSGYYETSAVTGDGITELCEAVANAINWEGFGKTSRPELFQAIRNEIEKRRKKGVVVVLFETLDQELQSNEESETFSLMAREVALASDAEAGTRALDAVCCQLAQQGIIAYTRTSSGKNALVFRVEEVERYAGSLIVAARNNPRGVPALEVRSILQDGFSLPGIAEKERLPPDQEKLVLECTVQLMLEHGICFQHEGLLIFPSLFTPASETGDAQLPHGVSLYYDFAGAIDNIYASLIAWLVLAKEFGKVRLWSDRAEFEVKDGGLCGLRKVVRTSGFAHVDVYFGSETPERQRKEFISFVEDHLARNGIELKEQVVVPCPRNFVFDQETLRIRIAEGAKDVLCPRCEERHSLAEGATEARERDPKITQHTWALRTQIEKQREKITKQVVQALATIEEGESASTPIRLLHLSDLHFTNDTPVAARLQWLLDDIKQDDGLGFAELDYLVVSGDFTDKGTAAGFEKAYEFVSGLSLEFGLSAERCIFVPGNHDVVDRLDAYARRKDASGLSADEFFQEGQLVMARDKDKYPLRFKPFSDFFFHKFVQRPYSLDYTEQGMAIPFWETGLQFLALNSCWQIDEFHRKRSGLRVEAVANAIKQAQRQEDEGRKSGQLALNKPLLRIAIWHHAVAGRDQMKETDFLGNLQKNCVRLALHGDVHEMRQELVGYRHEKKIHIVGSGSFGARAQDRPEAMPRLYNVLEIERDLKSARIHTRCQQKPDGPWGGWYEWPNPSDGNTRVAFYDIEW